MATFFTSDIHIGHKNIIHPDMPHFFHHRKYMNLDDMDEDITYKWNQQVGHSDQVYILGDLSFYKPEKTVQILQHLNGQKFLIQGNHDRSKNMTQEFKDQFQGIYKYHELNLKIEEKKQPICLFHFPIMHWNRQHHGSWHLHGHLHGSPSGVPGKILDVGWDAHGRLLSLEDVARFMESRPVRDNHHGSCGMETT